MLRDLAPHAQALQHPHGLHDRLLASLDDLELALEEPAVLIEVGYLSNPGQAAQVVTDAFQNALVQSLYDAVVKFRDTLPAGGTR